MLSLVHSGMLDAPTAALLWLLMENGASIIVGAGPQGVGKTTLLTAILDMLPPRFETVFTRGEREDFSFLKDTSPESTYVLVPELSNHTRSYLWGENAIRLFHAMADGYSMAATMHADTPEDVIWMLDGYPLYLSHDLLSNIDAIVNLKIMRGEDDIVRRVNNVTLLTPGPAFVTAAHWREEDDTFQLWTDGPARGVLAEKLGASDPARAIADRTKVLQSWLASENPTGNGFRGLIEGYYASQSP